MPRLRVNQCEMSATIGPKEADPPSSAISSPCASANCHRLVALAAAM
jgi:hypothetical protein